MIVIDHKPDIQGQWTALCWSGTHLGHVVGHADAVLRRAKVPRITVSDAELVSLIRSSTTTTPCPPAWVDTSLGASWTSSRGS